MFEFVTVIVKPRTQTSQEFLSLLQDHPEPRPVCHASAMCPLEILTSCLLQTFHDSRTFLRVQRLHWRPLMKHVGIWNTYAFVKTPFLMFSRQSLRLDGPRSKAYMTISVEKRIGWRGNKSEAFWMKMIQFRLLWSRVLMLQLFANQ